MVAQNGTAVSLEAVYDYYPYGAVMRSYENSPANMRLYQGKEWHDQLALNWYDFGSRYYDPVLGMWGSVDPQKQFASPYMAMGNNPVMMADPDGEWAFLAFVLGSGILKGIFNATKDGGWSWKDFGKGFLQGAALSAAMVGSFYLPTALAAVNIPGILPSAGFYGASYFTSTALQSGITSWALYDDFDVNWKASAFAGGFGAIAGAFQGAYLAKNSPFPRNTWTGSINKDFLKDYLEQFVNHHHSGMLQNMSHQPTWEVGSSGNTYGTTARDYRPTVNNPGGPAKISIKRSIITKAVVKGNINQLYLTTGHEIVHAQHFSSGIYDGKWYNIFRNYQNGVSNLSEIMAYRWSLNKAIELQFRVEYYVGKLNHYRNLLNNNYPNYGIKLMNGL